MVAGAEGRPVLSRGGLSSVHFYISQVGPGPWARPTGVPDTEGKGWGTWVWCHVLSMPSFFLLCPPIHTHALLQPRYPLGGENQPVFSLPTHCSVTPRELWESWHHDMVPSLGWLIKVTRIFHQWGKQSGVSLQFMSSAAQGNSSALLSCEAPSSVKIWAE